MKNILITGTSGMLGSTLANTLKDDYNVYSTSRSVNNQFTYNFKKFNLLEDDYDELIKWSNPEYIVLCGAITNGTYCKSNPIECFNVNGFSIQKFIESTDKNVKIIYISTDAVFPSNLNLANETHLTDPESIYGKSKELGEFFLKKSNRKYIIIRTTIVGLNLNKDKLGFVEWIINSSINKEEIDLFDDVIFNPISIWELSNEIMFLLKSSDFSDKILHISGNSVISKYNFGINLLREFNLSKEKVNKGRLSDYEGRENRSLNQTLDCSYYKLKYNRVLPNMNKLIQSIKHKYYE